MLDSQIETHEKLAKDLEVGDVIIERNGARHLVEHSLTHGLTSHIYFRRLGWGYCWNCDTLADNKFRVIVS